MASPRIYLDSNSTSRTSPEVLSAMLPWFRDSWSNPSSPHPSGERAADAVRAARSSVARLLNAHAGEIVFTSGGSEAIATAFGTARSALPRRPKVVLSTVEHSAVKRNAEVLAHSGADLITIPVDTDGRLDRELLFSTIGEDCALVSLILANNETGALSDLEGVGRACREVGALSHVDAVQGPGKVPVDVRALGFDLASISAHKFHGPKGVGALFVREGIELQPIVVGGPQEGERRAGTENVPGIVGMGAAATLARELVEDAPHLEAIGNLRDRLEQALLAVIPGARAHAGEVPRVPNTTNILFPGMEAGALLALLGAAGVEVSAGSACNATSSAPSPVLLAMGCTEDEASSSLRFSLCHETTDDEIERTLEVTLNTVKLLSSLA